MGDSSNLLEIKNLVVEFPISGEIVHAVNSVNLAIKKGESIGIVGESGCGKSVTFSTVMRLVKSPPAAISGEIVLNGRDILKLTEKQMRKVRGKEVAMIFQEPMRSLNPVMRIGKQITETLLIHERLTKVEAYGRALDLLKMVEIPDAEHRLLSYPHELSGGLRQRIMIAMALACNPQILLADEPTTALDVTIQAQILSLLKKIQHETGMSIVMITHDLGVVADIVDNVAVFYAGTIVEKADKFTIFKNPKHPYTIGLLNCIPTLRTNTKRLVVIEGNIPDPMHLPDGCAFSSRCKFATEQCIREKPPVMEITKDHICACHYADKIEIRQ